MSVCVFCSLQMPRSCFSLNYSISLREEGSGTERLVSAVNSSTEGPEVIEVARLKENIAYSLTVSARNHFQFSIDTPIVAEQLSIGGWSQWVWPHARVSIPYSYVWTAVCVGIPVWEWDFEDSVHLCHWLSLYWL